MVDCQESPRSTIKVLIFPANSNDKTSTYPLNNVLIYVWKSYEYVLNTIVSYDKRRHQMHGHLISN